MPQADKIPWSGWYWPMSPTPPPLAAAGGPLEKFEQYCQVKFQKNLGLIPWENAHHHDPNTPWSGHCHGWSAAAILEEEPEIRTTSLGITFEVADVKGLLTEVHCSVALDLWLGSRDVHGVADDVLKVVQFHKALLEWVRNGEPVVMDMNNGPAVWNHPVYAYEMNIQPDAADPTVSHVTCTVNYASDAVPPGDVGTVELTRQFRYWIRGDSEQPSDGDWEQPDHPGFIWHPAYVKLTAAGANPATPYLSEIESFINRLMIIPMDRLYFLVPRIKWPIGPLPPDREPDDLFNPLLFRGLVTRDGVDGRVLPALASAWEVDDDGRTYVFHLRPGVTFHDGSPVVADDVVFSYQAIQNRELGSPHRAELEELIESIRAADPRTVIIRLRRRTDRFVADHGWHWIVPQRVVLEHGWHAFAEHPVGAGPFTLLEGEPGHVVTLAPYAGYYLGAPPVERIAFIQVPDTSRRLEMVVDGQADVAVFEAMEEVQRDLDRAPHLRAQAMGRGGDLRLEVQNRQLRGRVPNAHDGAWNASGWGLDTEPQQGPAQRSPAGPYRSHLRAREPEQGGFDIDADLPEWRIGTWWRAEIRQRASHAMVAEPPWTPPTSVVFEVVEREEVDGQACFRLLLTYPDRPRRAPYQYADLWVDANDRVPVRGVMHIGSRQIPMGLSFVVEVLRTASGRIDRTGRRSVAPDPRWPDAAIELPTFEAATSTGGIQLSSPATPFPLRLEESTYTVELVDWAL